MNTNAPRVNPKTIRLAKAGNEEAFAEIYEAWVQPIYQFVFRKVSNQSAAEDITADVFFKVWKSLAEFKINIQADFGAWVYRIARNSVIDYYRLARKETSLEDIPDLPDENFSMETEAELTDRQAKLKTAFETLTPEYQKVIRLRYFEEMPPSKVAQVMRKKEGAVRTLTHRAMKALKEAMGDRVN